ncbi:MAG: ROK family protein [Bacilli bacterium]
MRYFLVFDMGGTDTKHAVVTEDGTFVEKGHFRTTRDDADVFRSDVARVTKHAEETYTISGIGVSLPGYVDSVHKSVSIAGAIQCLYDTQLDDWFETFTSVPVAIINDANAAAVAEYRFGNGHDVETLVVMTIGTGIGGGLIINGQLFTGGRFKAGEFGYMLTNGMPAEEPITYGHWGATSRLKKRVAAAIGVEEDALDLREVFDTLAMQSDAVAEVIDTWYTQLSYGLFNIASVLNPDRILLGGGISSRDEFIPTLTARIGAIKWVASGEVDVPVDRCHFQNDAGLVGALAHFLETEK